MPRHARRKLYDVHEATKSACPQRNCWVHLGELFAIEAEICGQLPQERLVAAYRTVGALAGGYAKLRFEEGYSE